MTRLRVTWRAAAVIAAAHARAAGSRLAARARRDRHVLMSAALVVLGLGGMLAGGALIGEQALGLVLIAESGGAAWWGLQRDDGTAPPREGERTVPEILERARRAP
jgi:hypothetical protein